jgi:hypothetical protein
MGKEQDVYVTDIALTLHRATQYAASGTIVALLLSYLAF